MKSLFALFILAAALAVGACNSPAGSAGATLTPVSSPLTSPATSPATSPVISPEVSASPS